MYCEKKRIFNLLSAIEILKTSKLHDRDLGQKHWKILSEEPNIVTDFVWKQVKAKAYTT